MNVNVFKVAASALVFTSMLTLSTVPSQAAGGRTVGSMVVRHDDLDLSKPADVVALYARIRSASARVCGSYDHRDVRDRRSWGACYDSAVAEAVANFGYPALTSLHDADGNEPMFRERIAALPNR
jgi:UrcA family protein